MVQERIVCPKNDNVGLEKKGQEFRYEKAIYTKLKEMPSSGSCITYKFLNSLLAP